MGGIQSGQTGRVQGYDTSVANSHRGRGYTQLDEGGKKRKRSAGEDEVAGAIASSGGMDDSSNSSVGGRRMLSATAG